jgi:5'-3' exonuclease
MMQFSMMLTGDVSDNVKGVHGIGQKKAEKLLQDKNTFGKIRAVCEAYKNESDNWKDGPTLRGATQRRSDHENVPSDEEAGCCVVLLGDSQIIDAIHAIGTHCRVGY